MSRLRIVVAEDLFLRVDVIAAVVQLLVAR
jgi:hypothetical protein